MRRTLADARRAMEEDLIPQSSDYIANRAREFYREQERKAEQQAARFISEREAEVVSIRNEALRELAEVRDGLEALNTASLPSEEFTAELRSLRERQAEAEAALTKAQEHVDLIEQIEEDVTAWWSEMESRQPQLQADWPW